jgi:hypothetical protein
VCEYDCKSNEKNKKKIKNKPLKTKELRILAQITEAKTAPAIKTPLGR